MSQGVSSNLFLTLLPRIENMIVITPFYAALLTLLYVILSFNVIRNRWRYKQSLGSGQEAMLEKSIRAHGNFSEYVPLVIIMMAFLEFGKESPATLHFFGIALIIGRLSHAIGIGLRAVNALRITGMIATFTCLIGTSIKLIILSLQNGF